MNLNNFEKWFNFEQIAVFVSSNKSSNEWNPLTITSATSPTAPITTTTTTTTTILSPSASQRNSNRRLYYCSLLMKFYQNLFQIQIFAVHRYYCLMFVQTFHWKYFLLNFSFRYWTINHDTNCVIRLNDEQYLIDEAFVFEFGENRLIEMPSIFDEGANDKGKFTFSALQSDLMMKISDEKNKK